MLNQPLPSHPQNAVATVASDGGVRGNIFGSNLGRLQQIKAKYDPNNAPGQQGPSKHNSFFSSALMSDESKRSKLLDAFFFRYFWYVVFLLTQIYAILMRSILINRGLLGYPIFTRNLTTDAHLNSTAFYLLTFTDSLPLTSQHVGGRCHFVDFTRISCPDRLDVWPLTLISA